jgi:hypothetical protein
MIAQQCVEQVMVYNQEKGLLADSSVILLCNRIEIGRWVFEEKNSSEEEERGRKGEKNL